MSRLFTPTKLGALPLQNALVMAPMTRCRALGNVPNALMATYYGQRSGAGLIITEGTATSPDALGYARIPGIFTTEQVQGWKAVTEAAHRGGARIFCQLMHTGRIGHPLNMPAGARVLAPSAIPANEQMYTDSQGFQPVATPVAMTPADIQAAIDGFVLSARHAISAGFDGVELHGANGYLLEQFLRPSSNQRTDGYGGNIDHRARFLLEVVEAVAAAVGKERVGLRLSPYGVFNDMPVYDEMEADYAALAAKLGDSDRLCYVHLVDHHSMGAPTVPDSIKATFRERFGGTLILSGGYDAARAEADLLSDRADLIAVGRAFLANPDLPTRWQRNAPLNTPDLDALYTPGDKGYTDYPTLG